MRWITHVTFPHAPHFFITALRPLQNQHVCAAHLASVEPAVPRYLLTRRESSPRSFSTIEDVCSAQRARCTSACPGGGGGSGVPMPRLSIRSTAKPHSSTAKAYPSKRCLRNGRTV